MDRDRAHEAPVVTRLRARTPAWVRAGGDAAVAGRALLLFCGAVVVAGALYLGVDRHDELVLTGTSATMVLLVAVSLRVPWERASWSTVAFPVAVLVALALLAHNTAQVAFAFVGLIPLTFVYLGLFHHGRTALAVLPVAATSYVTMVPILDSNAAVRLTVYSIVWWTTAQILSVAMSMQRRLQCRLREDARTDALTSLGNRRDLDERLTTAQPGDCLVLADLDHFKCVNDTQGHQAGDALLERFGLYLHQHLRRRDYAARYGGEEFVLILPRTEPVQAMNMLRALRTEWAEEGTGVTFSAGIALITEQTPPGSALAAADIALYRAKQAGRDRFRIASRALAVEDPGPAAEEREPTVGSDGLGDRDRRRRGQPSRPRQSLDDAGCPS
jgi:diguanylate cyclase (GGDEF)-like protein